MLETDEDNKSAELYIFGDITSWPWYEGDESSYGLVKKLQNLDVENITVHINSYGGEVAEGLAIYNTLKDSKMKVTTVCDGFACSAASVVFMSGDERIIKEASLLMIHNAWTYAKGDSNALKKQAADLEKITQASVNAYKSKATISEEKIKELMNDESWITADEAVEYGLATRTEAEEKDEKANQSAFQIVRNRMLQKNTIEAVDQIAEMIVGKIAPILNKKEPKKEEKDSTGWGEFFK
jgi:ATP-dependent Clp protease protease subunit